MKQVASHFINRTYLKESPVHKSPHLLPKHLGFFNHFARGEISFTFYISSFVF